MRQRVLRHIAAALVFVLAAGVLSAQSETVYITKTGRNTIALGAVLSEAARSRCSESNLRSIAHLGKAGPLVAWSC
jgi:hypothetical protein